MLGEQSSMSKAITARRLLPLQKQSLLAPNRNGRSTSIAAEHAMIRAIFQEQSPITRKPYGSIHNMPRRIADGGRRVPSKAILRVPWQTSTPIYVSNLTRTATLTVDTPIYIQATLRKLWPISMRRCDQNWVTLKTIAP